MRRDTASEISRITVDCTEKLGEVLALVRRDCEGEEREDYMRRIADVLANITMLAAPIYEEYPDLTPPQLR